MDLDLDGERAVVMAASKGLGRAVAERLVTEGATVLVTSSSAENLADAREHILDATDAEPDAVRTAVCDLSDPDSVADPLADGIDDLGGLDILVTNHGGTTPTTFADATVDDFDAAYDAVLKSTVVTIKTAMLHLLESEGSVTNLVAASALEPPEGAVVGSSIRASLFALSKNLASEYGEDGVRSNCVCPRGVETGRIESKIELLADAEDVSIEAAREMRTDELPVGRLGTPAEFAKVVAFVASDAAAYVTGEVVNADGGWHRRID